MSKQHQKPTISDRLRRGLAGILSLALLIGLLPASIVPAEAAHWATPYVNTLVDWGVMRGDISGNMAPERSITRAEFVAMMNRAYGYTRTAGHPFTDVRVRDWYNDDIDIGYNMGYFKGTSPTTASPNSPLTREQAAVLLARNMMLQPTVGETLGFSDSRTLSDWSRGLVGAAAGNGILGGYSDGSFKPQSNITRGEVAAMLVRAIGTPIQTEGDHTLGNVYGNVTVNTAGVKLRDGVVTGNLYLTGGIDLGDVLMENITVLGEIVVSGAGESNSSQSSVVLRNVTANAMTVDSISDQFVTIRAEGNTDIKTTTVRTNAYVDDSSLPGYGLWKVVQDGGSLLQLAGNVKEAVNKTPNSSLQVVQGVADKVTIDEKATGSSVLVDGDARVDELNLDVGASVTGEGDIKNLNVGAAGSTVEQLPDTVTIRPGITADVNGAEMNSSQAAQASSEPRLLAGYPRAKNVAPTSATLVFSVNKPGTIYWAVSAVSDGSVSEADLIENPAYGGKILQAGTINAAAANTEYTANVANLAMDGSYYISAILVDGRDKRSPVKVTAFSTPDGTAPEFIVGPTKTLSNVQTAQVTGTPNKSCQLYWALLPEGAAAPTPAEFKANAVRGNLGYGSMDVTKNVSQSINVNRGRLTEKTNYVAYLWLTDHDGAQSSRVYDVPIYVPDQTPPELGSMRQTNSNATSVETSFTMNETGRLYWAIVTDEMHDNQTFIGYDVTRDCPTGVIGDPGPSTEATTAYLNIESDEAALAAKIAVTTGTGAGAIVSGTTTVAAANTLTRIPMNVATRLDPAVYNTSTFYIYYVGEDSETPGNLSKVIGVKEVNVLDETDPLFVEQRFDSYNPSDLVHPLNDTSITLVFSEPIQSGSSRDRNNRFLTLYQAVQDALAAVPSGANSEDFDQFPAVREAREALADALHKSIKLYEGNNTTTPVCSDRDPSGTDAYILDYRYAQVERENGTGRMRITFPYNTGRVNTSGSAIHGANLNSGMTYHFQFTDIYDCAAPKPNSLKNNANGYYSAPEFRVAYAQVSLSKNGLLPGIMYNAQTKDGKDYFKAVNSSDPTDKYGVLTYPASPSQAWQNNPPQRMDAWFTVDPIFTPSELSDAESRYDVLIWADRDMQVSLYSRPIPDSSMTEDAQDQAVWTLEGTAVYDGTAQQTAANGGNGFLYRSLMRDFRKGTRYDLLKDMAADREYAIHVDMLVASGAEDGQDNWVSASWFDTVNFRISVVAGSTDALEYMNQGTRGLEKYNDALRSSSLSSIGIPDYVESYREFNPSVAPKISDVHVENDATRPVITVTLDNPGFVNYVIVELSNLMYIPDKDTGILERIPSNLRITEGMIMESSNSHYIEGYTPRGVNVHDAATGQAPLLKDIPNMEDARGVMGLTVSSPSPSSVVGTRFPQVFQQSLTTKAGKDVPQQIVLQKAMLPNTVYLLCLVPQGQEGESASRAKETVCFRLTTSAVTAPVLTLSNRSSINVNAKVSSDATVQAHLLIQDNLGDTVFGKKLNEIDDGLEENPDLPLGSYGSYTVMQALQTKITIDASGRSVFDIYASATLKQRIANLVINGSGGSEENFPGNTFYDSYGPRFVTAANGTVTDFDDSEQDDDTIYFCLGMAYIDQNGPWSFHALSNLTKVVDQQPKVNGIANGLTYVEADPTDPTSKNHIEGIVTVSFTTYLYLPNPSGTGAPLPLAVIKGSGDTSGDNIGTVAGAGGDRYVPLGPKMTFTSGVSIVEDKGPYVRTRSITFEVRDVLSRSVTLVIPEVHSQWNRSSNGSTTVILTYAGEGRWNITVTPANHVATGYNPNA